MRGEYTNLLASTTHPLELPPRARRILDEKVSAIQDKGTTSACAENTIRGGFIPVGYWNYLRVRGEYFRLLSARSEPLELPPRARRIRGVMFATYVSDGTTSACAENTILPGQHPNRKWNYLRVRGEYRMVRYAH